LRSVFGWAVRLVTYVFGIWVTRGRFSFGRELLLLQSSNSRRRGAGVPCRRSKQQREARAVLQFFSCSLALCLACAVRLCHTVVIVTHTHATDRVRGHSLWTRLWLGFGFLTSYYTHSRQGLMATQASTACYCVVLRRAPPVSVCVCRWCTWCLESDAAGWRHDQTI
jgi:hypothetical protein